MVRVDFPLPETPVTQVSVPKGISQLIFFKLLPAALITFKNEPLSAFLLLLGTDTFSFPERYWPVMLFLFFLIFFTGPSAITFPPSFPAAGPRSIMWSAVVIASSSCSTTITVLPKSRKRFNVPSSLLLSL